jgi:hypothetical protein
MRRPGRIITGDIAAAVRLEQLGIPFIDEWSLLEPEDLHASWSDAYELGGHWWEQGTVGTEYRGVPLEECARLELAWPFEACLNACKIYDRLLDSRPVRRIAGYFLPPVAVCQAAPHPFHRAITSIYHAVLRWCAARKGVPIRRLPLPAPLSDARGPQNHERPTAESARAYEPPVWAHLTAERPGWIGWDLPRGPAGLRAPGKRTVLLMPWLAAKEAADLEGAFQTRPGWRVVRVALSSAADGFTFAPWHIGEIDRSLAAARQAHRRWCARYSGAHPEIFANPFFRFQFERIWTELGNAARLGESFHALLDSLEPSLVVFGYDGFVIEQVLQRIARARGVPTASLHHGGLAPVQGYRPCLGHADRMMVWGTQDVETFQQYGVSPQRLQMVGSLRYEEAYRSDVRARTEGRAEAARDARRRLNVPEARPVFLLLTATVMGMASPTARPGAHRQTWRELLLLARRRPDFTFLIKPHPGWDSYELYRQLCAEGSPNLRFAYDATLEQCLAAADVAVLVNYCTTAALEAMLHGLPVVFLRTAIYPTPGMKDPLKDGGSLSVHSVGDLESVLDRLLRDTDFRRRALADVEPFLASFLGGEDGPPALDRLLQGFEELALPPPDDRGRGAAMLWLEIQESLAVARDLLRTGAASALVSAWGELVRKLVSTTPARPLIRQVLFSIAFDIGSAAPAPHELRRLIHACFRTAREALSLRAADRRDMLTSAYLAALTGRLRGGRIAGPEIIRHTLRDSPSVLGRLGQSSELLGALGSALDELLQSHVRGQTLQGEAELLRHERHQLQDLAQSLHRDLADVRQSWALKVGKLLVRPGSFLKKVIRPHPSTPRP